MVSSNKDLFGLTGKKKNNYFFYMRMLFIVLIVRLISYAKINNNCRNTLAYSELSWPKIIKKSSGCPNWTSS